MSNKMTKKKSHFSIFYVGGYKKLFHFLFLIKSKYLNYRLNCYYGFLLTFIQNIEAEKMIRCIIYFSKLNV